MSIKKRLLLMNIVMILIPTLLLGLVIEFVLRGFAYSFEQETGASFIEYIKSLPAQSEMGIGELLSESVTMLKDAEAAGNTQQALETIGQSLELQGIEFYALKDGEQLYSNSDELAEVMSAYGGYALWTENTKVVLTGDNATVHMESFKTESGTTSIFLIDRSAGNTNSAPIAQRARNYFTSNAMTILLSVLIILLLSCGLLASAVSASITRRIAALKRGMEEIRDGNLDYELWIGKSGQDELSQLCEGFNEMRGRLSESINMSIQYEYNRKALLASISHDLRTPITSITGYVDGLLDGVAATPEQQLRYLNTIKSKAEEMNILADNLLLFSTLDMGKAQFNMERVELGDYLGDCALEMEYQYEREGMQLSFENLCESPAFTVIDRVQFKRVIINLLENCSKYRKLSDAHVMIRLSEGNGFLTIEISDDGIGIPEEQLENIFDQFYRADASRGNIPGNGLGLAIVKQIVVAHGGSIQAKSGQDEGTTMIIKLKEV